jgi:hypothetical protein
VGVIGIEAFPLYWPEDWKRTPSYQRKRSRFKTSFAVARDQLVKEVGMLGGREPIISSNVALRRDSLPLAGQKEPADPGVAVYFKRQNKQQVLACDTYDNVGDNIHALELTIEALRAIGRHGATTILDRAFQGFTALPPAGPPWHQVLGVPPNASTDAVQAAYRNALSDAHPDRGGSQERFQAVQNAFGMFKAERSLT